MACCPKPKTTDRIYRPNYAFKALTEKFWAKHDNVAGISHKFKRIPYFSDEIEKRIRYDARERYYAPITQNQTYGWLEGLAEKYTGIDDEILMHRLTMDETMSVLKLIAFDVIRERFMKKL